MRFRTIKNILLSIEDLLEQNLEENIRNDAKQERHFYYSEKHLVNIYNSMNLHFKDIEKLLRDNILLNKNGEETDD